LRESAAIDFAIAGSVHSLSFVQERLEDRSRRGRPMEETDRPYGRSFGFGDALPQLRQSIPLGARVARPADSLHGVPWSLDGIGTTVEADARPYA